MAHDRSSCKSALGVFCYTHCSEPNFEIKKYFKKAKCTAVNIRCPYQNHVKLICSLGNILIKNFLTSRFHTLNSDIFDLCVNIICQLVHVNQGYLYLLSPKY